MIVKNEEKNIRRCLESVSPIVDEIIVVDTGSMDKTKDVCQEFHAKLFDFDWSDDFGKARNFGLSKATCDWIFWLDADEVVDIKDKLLLKTALSQEKGSLYSIRMHHLFGETPEENEPYYISYHFRLFRNNIGFYFHGIIHEKLSHIDINFLEKPVICDFLIIWHYGYQKEQIINKSTRNLSLLIKEKDINKENPWLDYHIAAELYRLNDINRAYSFVNNAIAMFVVQKTLPPALAYKLKYDIIIYSGGSDNAIKGIEKALELYPDYIELHFYRGITLFHQERFEEGIKAFGNCLVLGEYNPKYLILWGNGSFCAYYYMGRCYEEIKNYPLAKEAYRQSILSNPRFKPSLQRLELLKD